MLIMVKRYSVVIIPLLLLLVVNLTSCSVFDPPVVVPCYGHIDSISYSFNKAGYPVENSRFSYITDAWVFVDDNPVGVFQMPCTFPIVASNGVHQVKIFPGVKEDGVAGVRTVYPLYSFYTGYINLTQGSVVKMNAASVTYASFAKFDWTEDFESGVSLRRAYGSNVTMGRTSASDSVFQGSYSGRVVLDNTGTQTFIGRSDSMTLPIDGSSYVWLEINYNSNTMFSVGLYGQDTINQIAPNVYVYPTNGVWKKMYITLETTLAQSGIGQQPFSVYFEMQSTVGTRSVLLLDNIKLVQ